MNKRAPFLNNLFKKGSQVPRSVYAFFILIAVVTLGGGPYFWKGKKITREVTGNVSLGSCSQIHPPSPAPFFPDIMNATSRRTKKIIQSAKENGTIIISVSAISVFMGPLLEWMDASEKNGVNFVSVAGLKTSKPSLENTREHQGTTCQ